MIERYIEQGEKLRIVLNHRRQADNALRLGLIDEKRYKKTIERLRGKKEQAQSQEEAFRRFVSEVGFLRDLPTDLVAVGKVMQVNLVPEPGWFDERLEVLTDDQQAEYLQAFSSATNLGLITKYAQVRLTSLLRSMIFHPEQVDLPSIERECRAPSTIHGHSNDNLHSQVADVARFLGRSDPMERHERLDTLRQLDEKSCDGSVMTITLNLAAGSMTSSQADSTFRARPTGVSQESPGSYRSSPFSPANGFDQDRAGEGSGAAGLEPRHGTTQVTSCITIAVGLVQGWGDGEK